MVASSISSFAPESPHRNVTASEPAANHPAKAHSVYPCARSSSSVADLEQMSYPQYQ
jgi:hypothetical protein